MKAESVFSIRAIKKEFMLSMCRVGNPGFGSYPDPVVKARFGFEYFNRIRVFFLQIHREPSKVFFIKLNI